MGFYFRKSVKMGPFRMSFSKGGISTSFGVKGARVTAGPRGTYVTIGSNGFYYRQRIGSTRSYTQNRKGFEHRASTPYIEDASGREIKTANTTDLVESEIQETLDNINKRLSKYDWANAFGAVATVVCFVSLWYLNFALSLLGAIISFVIFLLLRTLMSSSKTYPLFYELDGEATKRYSAIQEALETLSSTRRMWRIQTKQDNYDWKRNAGASTLITRKPVSVGKMKPPFLATNVEVFGFDVGDMKVFFLPDYVFVLQGGKYGAVSYKSLEIAQYETRFIEDGEVPSDSKVVGQTWQYVNKKGGPDRRFSNNRQIPIVSYGFLQLTSPTGLNLHFHISSSQASESFANKVRGAFKEEADFQSRIPKSKANTNSSSWAYTTLNVQPGASFEAITFAYKQMVKMYHPDKVSHLAPEFVELAEERMKEINLAYEELKRAHMVVS